MSTLRTLSNVASHHSRDRRKELKYYDVSFSHTTGGFSGLSVIVPSTGSLFVPIVGDSYTERDSARVIIRSIELRFTIHRDAIAYAYVAGTTGPPHQDIPYVCMLVVDTQCHGVIPSVSKIYTTASWCYNRLRDPTHASRFRTLKEWSGVVSTSPSYWQMSEFTLGAPPGPYRASFTPSVFYNFSGYLDHVDIPVTFSSSAADVATIVDNNLILVLGIDDEYAWSVDFEVSSRCRFEDL